MDVKNVDISKLKPYYNNPRNNENSVDDVAKSIKKFGWQQPIVVDKDMVIIVGHTRYLAAKKLKLQEVPVHIAKELTENEAKAYRIADNKTAEISSWDYDKLNNEIDEAIAGTADDFGLRNMKVDNGGVDLDSLDEIVSDEEQTQTKRYLKISVTDESKRNFIFKEICKIALKLELEVK